MAYSDEFLWAQRYRPVTVAECILPDRIKVLFQKFVDTKNIPNLILSGTAGVGKTTVILAACAEIDCDYMMINGSKERGIDILRSKVQDYAAASSLMGGRKVILIDEADFLTPEAMAALRGLMEEFSHNASFVFTCNYKNKLIPAIHSRCSNIEFRLEDSERAEMAKGFFNRAKQILTDEQITFVPKVIAEVIKKHFPDYRRVLNELQTYAAQGNNTINEGILASAKDANVDALVVAMKAKNYKAVREWVSLNASDANTIYSKLYEAFEAALKKESYPQAVLVLADYAYKSAFVIDQCINLTACMTEIMLQCEFI